MIYTPKVPRYVNEFDKSLPKRPAGEVQAVILRRRAKARAIRAQNVRAS